MAVGCKEYARNAAGAALMALDGWREARSQHRASCLEEERALLGGRVQAYNAIFQLLVGVSADDARARECAEALCR